MTRIRSRHRLGRIRALLANGRKARAHAAALTDREALGRWEGEGGAQALPRLRDEAGYLVEMAAVAVAAPRPFGEPGALKRGS